MNRGLLDFFFSPTLAPGSPVARTFSSSLFINHMVAEMCFITSVRLAHGCSLLGSIPPFCSSSHGFISVSLPIARGTKASSSWGLRWSCSICGSCESPAVLTGKLMELHVDQEWNIMVQKFCGGFYMKDSLNHSNSSYSRMPIIWID
jgi:hypothetical protein